MTETFDPDAYLSSTSIFDPDAYLSSSSPEYSDVPGAPGNISTAAPKERSFLEKAEGIGEAALTSATGATTGALGYALGSVQDAVDKVTGGEDRNLRGQYADALTNTPESEAGQEYVQAIGDTLGVLPPVLGTAPAVGANALRSKNPLLNAAKDSNQNLFEQKIQAAEIPANKVKQAGEVVKQGFDESVTNVIANASPADKRAMRKQLNIIERGDVDAKFKAKNRAADVVGDSLLKPIKFVKSNNKQAGQQLNRIANSLKGQRTDISNAKNAFYDDLIDLGVSFDDGKPNFTGSQIETISPARKLVKDISLRLERQPNPDALQAHRLKQFIDENVSFGKKAAGLGGKTEAIAKSFRKNINEGLSEQFPRYMEANRRYSDTVQALDNIQDSAGRKVDFFADNSDKAIGTILRSLMNNTKGRAALMNSVEGIQDTAKKYGGSFDDDILTQMLFADELGAVFGDGARTSLRGETRKSGVDSAVDISQMSIPGVIGAGVKAGARKLSGINKKNQIKAIKKLLAED